MVPRPRLHLAPTPLADRPTLGPVTARLTLDHAGHRGWWPGRGAGDAAPRWIGDDGPWVPGCSATLQAELEAIQKPMVLGLLATDDGVWPAWRALQQAWMPWADAGFAVFMRSRV